ncbi:hypothetical protein [Sorangium sp. So ce1389]|uniref:hypothetical protein n=1 Tax=Sorangium sp. So ce1389 TaxID=3133336 RepID=UPI003F5E5300
MTDKAPADPDGPEPADAAGRSAPADEDATEPAGKEPGPARADGDRAGAEPQRRTKKRKARRGADAASPPDDGAPGQPRDPELARLVQAFERGDYALVRADAGRLAKEAERDDVRRAARALLRRIEPDPLAVALLVAAVALLAFLSLWYWSHSHASP